MNDSDRQSTWLLNKRRFDSPSQPKTIFYLDFKTGDPSRAYFAEEDPHDYSAPVNEFIIGASQDPDEYYDSLSRQIASLQQTLLTATMQEAKETRRQLTIEISRSRVELARLIGEANLTIVDCFRVNPIANIGLLSKLGMLFTSFSLILSISTGIHLINPLFALLCLVAAGGFLAISKVERRSTNG